MLTKTGVKLMDFGLAKSVSPPSSTLAETLSTPQQLLTGEGIVLGTIPYMSPEQVEGREVDRRSDIFSLGAVLYEMATGKRAFAGKNQLSIASAILENGTTCFGQQSVNSERRGMTVSGRRQLLQLRVLHLGLFYYPVSVAAYFFVVLNSASKLANSGRC